MAPEDLARAVNQLTEAWKQISDAVKELANSLSRVFECSNQNENQVHKPSANKYCKSSKRRPPKNDAHINYNIERKVQKHLPYQRRNY
jgi:uncharacterized protein YoxC